MTDDERTIGPPFIPSGQGEGVHTGWQKQSWLSSIGFFLRTTFPTEINGNFRPSYLGNGLS